MAGASSLKRSVAVNDSVRERIRNSARSTTKEDTSDNIQGNAIYKIMLAGNATPNERKAELAKLMTSTLDKEQDRANIKAYEEFREWLSHQNTKLAEQIIELTNTDTFASLQRVIEDMNKGLIDFETDLQPLMEIIDSIYQLRTSGDLHKAYQEIENDRKADEQRKVDLAQKEQERIENVRKTQELRVKNVELAQKRGLFGYGNITEAARKEIAANELLIQQSEQKAKELADSITQMRNETINRQSELGEMAVHKERLRELLDLSSEENSARVVRLRDSALNFVSSARDNTNLIRGEFGTLTEQLDKADDNNRKMVSIYAIMTEGMKTAATTNLSKRDDLEKSLGEVGDDIIAKMETEDKLRNLDSHSKMLHSAQGETLTTYGELSQQTVRVNSMKEATNQQVDVARKLNTQGVSATADRLASVMTAVSGAAISESAGVVEQTLDHMRRRTNEITQQEVIRNAMNVDKINNDMESVFAELESFRDTQKASSDIVRQGLTVMNENMTALFEQTEHLRKELRDAEALHTKMAHGEFARAEDALGIKPDTNQKTKDSFSF